MTAEQPFLWFSNVYFQRSHNLAVHMWAFNLNEGLSKKPIKETTMQMWSRSMLFSLIKAKKVALKLSCNPSKWNGEQLNCHGAELLPLSFVKFNMEVIWVGSYILDEGLFAGYTYGGINKDQMKRSGSCGWLVMIRLLCFQSFPPKLEMTSHKCVLKMQQHISLFIWNNNQPFGRGKQSLTRSPALFSNWKKWKI